MISVLIAHPEGVVAEALAVLLAKRPHIAASVQRDERDGEIARCDVLVAGGDQAPALVAARPAGANAVVLAPDTQGGALRECLRAGALGLLGPDARGEDLFRAIESVASGQVAMSTSVAMALASQEPELHPSSSLTSRELEVLMLLAEGAGDKEIGSSLGITVRTASSHVAAVLGKLGVQSRGRAAAYAYRTGLVPPDATTDYSKRG